MDWQAVGYAVTAFFGAVAALVLNWFRDWIRRPKLSMEIDLTALKEWVVSNYQTQTEIRLKVKNSGNSPAEYCEAKIEPLNEKNESLFDPSMLHWVRNYLVPEKTPDHYAPITINSNDHEFLAMIVLRKEFNFAKNSLEKNKVILTLFTASHRPYDFVPNFDDGKSKYKFKVTIFSKNHNPISSTFNLFWNGTWDGFTSASVQLRH